MSLTTATKLSVARLILKALEEALAEKDDGFVLTSDEIINSWDLKQIARRIEMLRSVYDGAQ